MDGRVATAVVPEHSVRSALKLLCLPKTPSAPRSTLSRPGIARHAQARFTRNAILEFSLGNGNLAGFCPQLPKLRVAGSSPVSRSKVNYLRVSGTVWFRTSLPRFRGELREPGRAETLILDSQAVGPARASHSLRSDEVFGRHNPSVRQSGCQRQAQSDGNASLRDPQNCACFGSAHFWHITG